MEEEGLFSSLFAVPLRGTRSCRTLGVKIEFSFCVPVAPGVPVLRGVAAALRIQLPKRTQKRAILLSVELRDFVLLCLFDSGGGRGHPCSLGPVATHQLHVSTKGCVAVLVVLTGGFPPL